MNCPQCGSKVESFLSECPNCRAPVHRPGIPPPHPAEPSAIPHLPAQPPVAYQSYQPHMIACVVCHQPISSAAPVCPSCGQPNPTAAAQQTSPLSYVGYVLAVIGFFIFPIIVCPIGMVLGGVAMSQGDKKHGLRVIIYNALALVLGIFLGAILIASLGGW